MEDRLGKKSAFGKKAHSEQNAENEESSSESEDEDDEGVLATETMDSEIAATLNAIRSKDPRVYDSQATFFRPDDDSGGQNAAATAKQPRPMFLRDYHRENYLSRANGDVQEEEEPQKPYVQEQEDLKRSIVREMHAAADDKGEGGAAAGDEEGDEGSEEDAFLIKKPNQEKPSAPAKAISDHDIVAADKDPETFLSNFMAARAWVPTDRANFQPFESDDEEQETRAEAFEEAYNFRFEDPNKINEVLTTHARDTTSKYSVRREEFSGRKKKRQTERERKEEEKQEREAERARLRKLKIEQLEDKVAKIKLAAGINASDIRDEEWARFLDMDWDDAKWEEEMQKRFGDDYYARDEGAEDQEQDDGSGPSKKRRLKKPTWDDDIDIKDIVPDFDSGNEANTSDQGQDQDQDQDQDQVDVDGEPKSHKKKDRLRDKKEKQREARKERRRIEQAVDENLDLESALLPGSSKKFSGQFRYREGSPVSFGLTARDILMAEDRDLNQHAGLKKLASFRDPTKKKRDRKHLGKKARLRQWRQDTFGDENGAPADIPQSSSSKAVEDGVGNDQNTGMDVDIRDGKKKKKRKRGKKQ